MSAPRLRNASAKVNRATRSSSGGGQGGGRPSGGQGGGSGGSGGGDTDPWASEGGGSYTDEPPF